MGNGAMAKAQAIAFCGRDNHRCNRRGPSGRPDAASQHHRRRTLEIHGTRIRLWGIDAPESSQLCRGEDSLPYRCGAKVANELAAFISSRPMACMPVTIDRYGRAAVCNWWDRALTD
jgi:endonuclease YncB( thermonuclease family)